MRRPNLILMPVCEAGLLLVLGLAAWLTGKPLLFASLGPTAYELAEAPERPTARSYNIIVGHGIGVLSGFAALFLTHRIGAWSAAAENFPLSRVLGAALAALLTVFGTLLVRATQPAAVSTTLLVALGFMPHWLDGVYIMAAILLITALGQALQHLRTMSSGPEVDEGRSQRRRSRTSGRLR